MTKIISIIIAVMAITGCSATITSGELQRATDRCKDNGGIDTLYAPTFFGIFDFTNIYGATCNNGVNININHTKP